MMSSGTINQYISGLTVTGGARLLAGIFRITHNYHGPVNLTETKQSEEQIPSYYEVPNRRVQGFVGREDILQRIDKALSDGSGPHYAVLQGMGGQGKSQVALEYCHRKKDSPYSAIFWLDASTQDRVEESFHTISERIKRPTDYLPDINARVAFVLKMFTSWTVQWLMVFDNYDNLDAFRNIRDYFPQSRLGAILVTSRHPGSKALVSNPGNHFIELFGLEVDAAVALLIQKSQTNEGISEDAKKIVERLMCHPMAVTQAGAYIGQRNLPFCKFMDHYKGRKKKILENTPQLSQYQKRLGNAEKETSLNVFTTWELSFQQLQSEASENFVEAKELLTLLAFFDGKDISEQLFKGFNANQKQISESAKLLIWLNAFRSAEGQWDSNLFEDVLILLRNSSLLQACARELDEVCHASLHPLIKDWILLRTDKSIRQENTYMAATLVKEILVNAWQEGSFDLALLAKQNISSHIFALEESYQELLTSEQDISSNQNIVDEYKSLQVWFIGYSFSAGSYGLAEIIHLGLKEQNEKILGLEHPDTLVSMALLASAYWHQGKWKEAEKLEKQVMETSKRVLGHEHPSTLTSMTNLASTYQNQGRWEEAKKLGEQVRKTRLRVLGPEHPDTLTSTANLASTFCNQGRWKEAEELYVQVKDASLRELGPEHALTLIWTADLASTYRNQGHWKEAEELEVQVRETSSKVLGLEHPHTLASTANLASTILNQGRWKEAEELYVQVREANLRVLGPEHPSTLTSMANLASTYQDQGLWKEAEELYVQVRETNLRKLGPEHPSTLTSMANLALTYRDQGRWKEAEELYVQVLETSSRILGREHPDTLTSMANLAVTYQNLGQLDKAAEMGVEVMETRKRVLRDEHPSTLISMANLSSTFWNQGRLKEAEDLELQVMETRKRVLGDEHPSTLTSMSNLASIYWDQGKRKEANEQFEHLVKISSEVLGSEHPDTLAHMNSLAITSWCLDLKKEAIQLMIEVVEYRREKLGSDHPDTCQSVRVLAKWQNENLEELTTC